MIFYLINAKRKQDYIDFIKGVKDESKRTN